MTSRITAAGARHAAPIPCAPQGEDPPHPIPYQGSKRHLAPQILATVEGRRFRRLYEPFAGSAALTLAAGLRSLAAEYILADSLTPLAALWRLIVTAPEEAADRYEALWCEQSTGSISHYYQVRDTFNADQDPVALLYLLARCVKNAPRFNRRGQFNQSPDKRRRGMRPEKMRGELRRAAAVLHARVQVRDGDFERTLADAMPADLVYLDPPYEGISAGDDRRYHQGMERERLIAALAALNQRGVPWILSYDGQCGTKRYGAYLPDQLGALRLDLRAGRSSQATLHGRNETTIESLYLSPLVAPSPAPHRRSRLAQASAAGGVIQT